MRMYGKVKGRRWDTLQPTARRKTSSLKVCTRCGRAKTLDEFYQYVNTNGYERLRAICKACLRESRL